MLEMRIWIGNLAKYNEGQLIGEWVDLPCYELDEVMARILGQDEEYFIADHEGCPFDVSEHSSPFTLNDYAEQCEKMEEHEIACLKYLTDYENQSFEQAIENYRDVDRREESLRDLAWEYVEEGLLGEMSQTAMHYIDLDLVARDFLSDWVKYEGYFYRWSS